MLSKGGAERTEKLNTIDFSTQSFPRNDFDRVKSNFRRISQVFAVHFLIVSSRSLLLVALRRDSTPQEFAIQVGTPRRGNTQRINTMYVARNAINQSQSGIYFSSSLWQSILKAEVVAQT